MQYERKVSLQVLQTLKDKGIQLIPHNVTTYVKWTNNLRELQITQINTKNRKSK